jgi:large subunit ribosomal protein L23
MYEVANMADSRNVIQYPLITEDVVNLIEEENKITFIVDMRADKKAIKRAVEELYIKRAVEELYEVDVDKVNTLITSKGLKKAFVKLAPESKASDLAIKLGIF